MLYKNSFLYIVILVVASAFSACSSVIISEIKSPESQKPSANIQAEISKFFAICERSDLQEIFQKTSCNAFAMSTLQLKDSSNITASQKIQLQIMQQANSEAVERIGAMQTSNQVKNGISLEEINRRRDEELAKVKFDIPKEIELNEIKLLTGSITWGDYNIRRQEIARQVRERVR